MLKKLHFWSAKASLSMFIKAVILLLHISHISSPVFHMFGQHCLHVCNTLTQLCQIWEHRYKKALIWQIYQCYFFWPGANFSCLLLVWCQFSMCLFWAGANFFMYFSGLVLIFHVFVQHCLHVTHSPLSKLGESKIKQRIGKMLVSCPLDLETGYSNELGRCKQLRKLSRTGRF